MNTLRSISADSIRQLLTEASIDPAHELAVKDHIASRKLVDPDGNGPWRLVNVVHIAGPQTIREGVRELLTAQFGLQLAVYRAFDQWSVPPQEGHTT